MTHAEMTRRLSAREFIDWVAFYRLEAEATKKRMTAASGKRGG
jgi:hypothetical protein